MREIGSGFQKGPGNTNLPFPCLTLPYVALPCGKLLADLFRKNDFSKTIANLRGSIEVRKKEGMK